MFHNSQAVITGGSFKNFQGRRGIMDLLKEEAVPGAFHNSLQRCDPPKCHKHTREAILEKIMDWVMKKIDSDAFIMWLYGAAGAGKSAIAQTIAELCEELKLLLASFFFFRSDPLRSNSRKLVATVAYQIAVAIPGVRGLMEAVIENDPLILCRSLITQFTALIVEPLERLLEISIDEHVDRRNLIIIDGLDECMGGTQVQILDMIFAIGKRSKFPFLFLVASRPELDISAAMGDGEIRDGLGRLRLYNNITSHDDIRRFLKDKFDEICLTHPIRSDLPSSWPLSKDLEILVDKSSGQFIYASTIVKFVSSRRHRPNHRLEIILGLRPNGKDLPFAELDALYKYILSSVEDTTMAVQIIAAALTLTTIFRFEALTSIFNLSPSDIQLHLIDLGSLVECGDSELNVLHASLGDFLFDEARSQELYVNRRLIYTKIMQALLRQYKNVESSRWLMFSFNELEQHCSKAELTPDLITQIRHLPVKRTLSQAPVNWTLEIASHFIEFAKFIPSLDIECADLISARYLSEIDEAIISFLNSCPSSATRAFSVLHFSDALAIHHYLGVPNSSYTANDCQRSILPLHEFIFRFSYDDIQQETLFSIVFQSIYDRSMGNGTLLLDFLSNPQRSQHRAVDDEMHSSVTERCLSYILNHRLAYFPGIHRWADKFTRRPWLGRRRNPKGILTTIDSQSRWGQRAHVVCNKKLVPFWALVIALKYLPYLLNKATRSEELIALAKMWSYQPFLLSLFPHDAKKAGKAIRQYLAHFDGKQECVRVAAKMKSLHV